MIGEENISTAEGLNDYLQTTELLSSKEQSKAPLQKDKWVEKWKLFERKESLKDA